VLEVGTHSPWVSRYLVDLGHEVIVANPRRVRLITDSTRKDDRLNCDPAGENPATAGRNYGLLRKEMRTCESCWCSAHITFWVPSDGTVIYDAGDCNWLRAAGKMRRSGHWWRSLGQCLTDCPPRSNNLSSTSYGRIPAARPRTAAKV